VERLVVLISGIAIALYYARSASFLFVLIRTCSYIAPPSR
jgi:hypothetical protein